MARLEAEKRERKKRSRVSFSGAGRWVFRLIFRTFWWIGSRIALAVGAVLAVSVAYFFMTLPPVEDLLDGRDRGSVVMTDRNGAVFAWRGEQFGGDLQARSASPHLVNAVIATEDKRFQYHLGIDPIGITRAMVTNARAGRVVQGGSTITQQVAKLLFFDNTRSIERHIKQIPIVLAMEMKYAKEDILSIYLNRVYLGAGTNGFEAASQRYFGKSAREVTIPEAAMLAGLLKAPSRYAPTSDLAGAQNRASVILSLMEDQGYITSGEANAAKAAPAVLSAAAEARAGGSFADWIMEAAPDYLTKATTEDVEIETTFDPVIQRHAEAALAHVFDTQVREGSKAQAAIVVMSPDGAVRAIVGGRQIEGEPPSQFNRATQALRQTGSSFKPFIYAAALERGYTPNTIVEDAPITIEVPGSKPWSPKNYSREFFGKVPFSFALANSLNAAAVRVSEHVGSAAVKAVAKDFGVVSPIADGPAFALGASEATLLEMTGAYAGILNGGRRAEPYGFLDLSVRGDDTPIFEGGAKQGAQVLNERAAGHLVYMLTRVVEEGSGQRARIEGRQVAGKTGTTQGARDAWFIGFTAQYVTGVWMGYDDNSQLTGVTGGGLPAEIWREVTERVHQDLPPLPLPVLPPPSNTPVASASGAKNPSFDDTVVGRLIRSIFSGGN